MREWLRGGAPPCQGGGRGFESRLALFLWLELLDFSRISAILHDVTVAMLSMHRFPFSKLEIYCLGLPIRFPSSSCVIPFSFLNSLMVFIVISP